MTTSGPSEAPAITGADIDLERVHEFPPDPDQQQVDEVARALEQHGRVVLEPHDDTVDGFLRIGSVFGRIQRHVRSAQNGMTEATPAPKQPSTDAEWQQHLAEYQSYGTDSTPPHTDGTFLDGLIVDGAGVRRVRPPRFVMLHVIHNASEGGENLTVDTAQVLAALIQNEPDVAATLMTPGCMSYCRDDQIALDLPVFQPRRDGSFTARFRGDSKAYGAPWALEAISRVLDHYHENEPFLAEISVQPGEILVVDNHRMLHGRRPFIVKDESRLLRRLWILDEDADVRLANLAGQVPASRALDTYHPYRPQEVQPVPTRHLSVRTGVRLPKDLRDKALAIAASVGVQP